MSEALAVYSQEPDDIELVSAFSGAAPKLTAEELDDLIETCFSDPEEFMVTFLPDLFPKKMPWFHKALLAIGTGQVDWLVTKCTMQELDKITRHFVWKEDPDDEYGVEHPIFKVWLEAGEVVRIDMDVTKFTECIIPRGFSKTTLMGLGLPLYKIVYQVNKFIVYVSETATAAEKQAGNVRYELASNPMIHLCFGNLKPDKASEYKWNSEMFETITGITVAARGRGGQIRGMNNKGQRPDCIILDDVEDKESVATVEQRLKAREWFYADVIPALPQMDENATIMALGTILHAEALLLVLARDPEWTSVILGATDRDGDALWSDNMDLEKLDRKRRSYQLVGLEHAYYMEFQSVLRNPENAPFQSKFFILKPEWRGDLDAVGLAADPAISEKKGADLFALGCVGITTKGFCLVLNAWGRVGVPPDEQVDLFFEWSKTWGVTNHGVETIAYQKALKFMIKSDMFRRGVYFPITEIKHGRTAKDERIKGILQPRYHSGHIAHYRKFPEYESQLLDYPKGKKDIPDAVAMAITLLDPFAANIADPENNDLEADEYEPMDEWRNH